MPIVSHSPWPEGDSRRHLPPRLGGDNTRQADESQSPRGWAGGQTNKGGHYLRPRPWSWLGGGRGWVIHAWSPEPPGPAQRSSMEQHHLPQALTMQSCPGPSSVPHPVPTTPPPPVGGWVVGRTENCLKVKGQTIVWAQTRVCQGGRRHTAPNQDISCDSDCLYYPLGRCKQNKNAVPLRSSAKVHTIYSALDLVEMRPSKVPHERWTEQTPYPRQIKTLNA